MIPEFDGFDVLRAPQADTDLGLTPSIFLTAKGKKKIFATE